MNKKLHSKATSLSSLKCSEKLIQITPQIMQMIRHEMRKSARLELSVPQFRVLARLHSGSVNVGELAEWIGVSLPAMSRMVDGLVQKNYIVKIKNTKDRRTLKVSLTKKGLKLYHQFKHLAQNNMAEKIDILTENQKNLLLESFEILKEVINEEMVDVFAHDTKFASPIQLRT